MKKKLFLSISFFILIASMIFFMPNYAYALCNQDPADINLDSSDLTGFTLTHDQIIEGPLEAAEQLSPYSETTFTNWGFEVGSHRTHEKTFYGVISAWSCVHRFSTVQGAKSALDFRHDALSEHIIPMAETIGDESFAIRQTSLDIYGIYFRKSNIYAGVNGDSFAEAKEYARIIESKIEIPSEIGDFLFIIIGIGAVVIAVVLIVVFILMRRRTASLPSPTPSTPATPSACM